jgi:hypothetical protein
MEADPALVVQWQDMRMTLRAWVIGKLRKIPKGRHVYDSVQPRAEGAKAILQIIIGVSAVIILIIQLCIHMTERPSQAADHALIIIGVALAFSAVVELAYTFFTDGPDEALDPLILGISSFALIKISSSKVHLKTIAIPVLLLTLAILALFIARRFLLEVRRSPTDAEETTRVEPPTDSYLG